MEFKFDCGMKLTEGQIERLKPLFDEVEKEALAGRECLIVAQVWKQEIYVRTMHEHKVAEFETLMMRRPGEVD